MLFAERYRRLSSFVLAFALLFAGITNAEPGRRRATTSTATAAGRAAPGTARPQRAADWWTEAQIEVVQSPLASLAAAVDAMYTSYPFQFPDNPNYAISGREIADYEWMALRDFIDGTGEYEWARAIPPARRAIRLTRYHLSDHRIVEELIRAKNLGFKTITLTTDLNDSMDMPAGQTFMTDFSLATRRTSLNGQAITALLAAGFRYNDERFGIFSPPLERVERRPLMHEKGLLLLTYNARGKLDRSVGFHGTANLSIHDWIDAEHAAITRYNRTFRCIDPLAIEYHLEHVERLNKAFAAGLGIHQMDQRAPRRIVYANGEHQEIAHTDGRYMPNDRPGSYFTSNNPRYALASQFVGFTNGRFYDAIQNWLIRNREATLDSITDGTFLDGFARIAGLDGFDHMRPFGGMDVGVSDGVERRANMLAWQAGLAGHEETEWEGEPIHRIVWHDKTTLAEEEAWSYVWTGSLNASNNFHNAECQLEFKTLPSSPIPRATKASVLETARLHPNEAVDLPTGFLRLNAGRMIGRRELTFPLDKVRQLALHIKAKRFAEAVALLEEVMALPNPLRDQPTADEVRTRLTRFRAFLDWHGTEMSHMYRTGVVGLRRLVGIAHIMATPNLRPNTARSVLWSALYDTRDSRNTTLREQRVAHAWGLLFPGTTVPVYGAKEKCTDDVTAGDPSPEPAQ